MNTTNAVPQTTTPPCDTPEQACDIADIAPSAQRALSAERARDGLMLMGLVRAALGTHGETNLSGGDGGTDAADLGTATANRWARIHALAAAQSLQAISWMGVNTDPALVASVPAAIASVWENEANLTLYRQITFDMARERILAQLSARGISSMPLKGVHTATYYPQPGMRSMSDNDILVGFIERGSDGTWQPVRDTDADERLRRIVIDVMSADGYDISEDTESDTGFIKKPFLSFEMHRMLEMRYRGAIHDYYANPWRRAQPDAADPHLMRWSLEDQYLFHITHMQKHYAIGGCGLRFVVDERVLLDRMGRPDESGESQSEQQSESSESQSKQGGQRQSGADWRYINDELSKLGLTDFERRVRHLAEALFGGARIGNDDAALFLYMLDSGTYGTAEHQQQMRMQRALGENADMPERYARIGRAEGGIDGSGDGDAAADDASTGSGRRMPIAARLRYIWRRLYPERSELVGFYPLFARHPWLIPISPLYRVFVSLRRRPDQLRDELQRLGGRKSSGQ
ncbi:nucleotidyltransferase family protein [Bifidobacterium jacchi]|uniref:Nucleotidyltransferase family protein n=1 Tax=Bifidobacterium jacchi TaxID=2490545 RepID=A0A5N5RJH4_9BIFI|nr:nucleotidyltransferase family protein [Bifidobacterium jacchi]KAB5607397.1 hypothetical protein EHS19_04930 [Bifidobacterium jacchi]